MKRKVDEASTFATLSLFVDGALSSLLSEIILCEIAPNLDCASAFSLSLASKRFCGLLGGEFFSSLWTKLNEKYPKVSRLEKLFSVSIRLGYDSLFGFLLEAFHDKARVTAVFDKIVSSILRAKRMDLWGDVERKVKRKIFCSEGHLVGLGASGDLELVKKYFDTFKIFEETSDSANRRNRWYRLKQGAAAKGHIPLLQWIAKKDPGFFSQGLDTVLGQAARKGFPSLNFFCNSSS
jgi:hypothetical protein